MKKLIVSQLMMLLVMSTFFFSCKKSGDDAPIVLLPKLDGLYVYGTNTIAEGPTDPNARMSLAILDPGKGAKVASMDGVYGKFLYIGANSTIKFASVVSEVGTQLGAENGGVADSAKNAGASPIKDIVIHGTLKADAADIKVTDEGLYYAFVNMNTNTFILMKVRANMIGDATLLQWNKGTALGTAHYYGTDSTVFQGDNIELDDAHGYRYRFNDGWAVWQDADLVTLHSMGVPSYGDAWATDVIDLGFFLDNIPHKVTGLYSVFLKYNAATGEWTQRKKKTGNVVLDYSNTSLGFFGSAYLNSKGVQAGWGDGDDILLQKPAKSGTTYTWTWSNVALIQDGQFVIRQDAGWAGMNVDYLASTVSGQAITDGKIKNAKTVPDPNSTTGGNYPDNNFYVAASGNYDITYVVNATTGAKTTSIKVH